jgi:hypothetical protein
VAPAAVVVAAAVGAVAVAEPQVAPVVGAVAAVSSWRTP